MIVTTSAWVSGMRITVDMQYEDENPAAMTFIFHQGEEATTWTFARDLLVEAFEDGQAGEGDVQFDLDLDLEELHVRLEGEEGVGHVLMRAVPVRDFLDDTLMRLPTARESYEWDETIRALLGES